MADYMNWAYGTYGYDRSYSGGASVNTAYNPSGKGDNNKLNTHRYTRNDIRVAENDLKPLTPYTNSKVMLSTNIFIYSNQSIVGMLQSFAVSEQRQINKLQAIGWEGVVQAVPSNTRGGSLSVNRIALYNSTLYNALGLNTYANAHNKLGSKVHTPPNYTEKDKWDKYTFEKDDLGPTVSSGLVFRTLKDQRAPLEIMVKTRLNGSSDGSGDTRPEFYTVSYVDCWLSQYSKPYSVQTIYVAETATIQYAINIGKYLIIFNKYILYINLKLIFINVMNIIQRILIIIHKVKKYAKFYYKIKNKLYDNL